MQSSMKETKTHKHVDAKPSSIHKHMQISLLTHFPAIRCAVAYESCHTKTFDPLERPLSIDGKERNQTRSLCIMKRDLRHGGTDA